MSDELIIAVQERIDVVTEGIQGPPGPPGESGGSMTTASMGALIDSATEVANPINADMFPFRDSVTGLMAKFSWTSIKAAIKTFLFGGATQGGVFFANGSEAPIQDSTGFLYDLAAKTLKLLESGYNQAAAGWNASSPSALQIGNNNTPHTFGSNPGFFGQKIDIYGAASSGNFKQLSGIRVRAQFAASGASNGQTTTAVEAFVSNPDDTTANANALLQALEGVVQVPKSIGRAQAGAFINNPGGAANPTINTVQGVYSQIGNAGAFSATDVEAYRAWVVTGAAVIQNLYGLRLNGWSGTGIVNSYGIYLDATIDRGNTLKYAIYSLSTSPSVFSGPVSGVINPYNATSWNGSAKFATEDAVRDEIEAVKAVKLEAYVHQQSTPATEWIVNHNLGYYPTLSVRDTGGVVGIADVIHFSVNQARVYFAGATAGEVRCV